MSSDRDIRIEIRPPYATILLDRPQARNAMTLAMWRALPLLVEQAENAPGVRVVLLSGADGSAFCAGGDIAEFEAIYATPKSTREATDIIVEAQLRLEACARPTIAVIRGPCVGGGLGLALACDARFAETSARFAVTPAKLGLAYSYPDTARLVRAAGTWRARDLLFTGRMVDATEAMTMGLVNRVVPNSELDDVAAAYAGLLAANSRASITAQKSVFAAIEDRLPADEAERRFMSTFAGPDFQEGRAAFLEKRRPRFGA